MPASVMIPHSFAACLTPKASTSPVPSLLISEQGRIHLDRDGIGILEPCSESFDLGQLVSKEETQGMKLASIKLTLPLREILRQGPQDGQPLLEPCPCNGDDPEKFELEGRVRKKPFHLPLLPQSREVIVTS
jgi:hypothetical protein